MQEKFAQSEFPMKDPQSIWQNQSTEAFKMSAAQLTQRAQKRQFLARLETAFSIVLGIALCAFFAMECARAQGIPRLGLAVLSGWSAYFGYQAYRWIWPRVPADLSAKTTLDSYRCELEKRRDYVRHIWRRAGLTFCFLGVALVVIPGILKFLHSPSHLVAFVPLFVILVVWCAIFFPLNRRKQRKLQQEIEALRALEGSR
jgi:hypothetical protein